MDNPEKLATLGLRRMQTQYLLEITIRKQTHIT
jgi:hypothetical protein